MDDHKIIRDIWIMKSDGTILFSRLFNKNLPPELFAGMISALEIFSKGIDSTGISNISIGGFNYHILKENDLFLVANCNDSVKKKIMLFEMQKIFKLFIETYGWEQVNNSNGEISVFENFHEKIKDSIEVALNNFHNAIW